jgi:hypothetical protein
MTYFLIGAGVLGGIILGWSFRHTILTRQLKQSRKQMEEIKTLQMTLEHEVSAARKKLMTHSRTRAQDESVSGSGDTGKTDIGKTQKTVDHFKAQLVDLKRENDDLQDQVGYLETEKESWLHYRNTAQQEIQRMSLEIEQLQVQITTLKNDRQIPVHAGPAGQNPVHVDRLPAGQALKTENVIMEKTQEIQIDQDLATDRVRTRVPSEEQKQNGILKTEEDPVEQADSDVWVKSEKTQLDKKQKTGKDSAPKKKPKTVRIDRSTNDIIDNFKRDFGLPDY